MTQENKYEPNPGDIQSTKGGIVITGDGINYALLLQLKGRLSTEIRTGLAFSRGRSTLSILNSLDILPKKARTKQQGLDMLTTYLEDMILSRKTKDKR